MDGLIDEPVSSGVVLWVCNEWLLKNRYGMDRDGDGVDPNDNLCRYVQYLLMSCARVLCLSDIARV
jgi:hypothetical protein